MKVLLLLLLPLFGNAQPMTLDKLFDLFSKRANEQSLIKEIKSIGYDKEEVKEKSSLYLKGSQSVMELVYNNGRIDGVGYLTLDSSTYAIWPGELSKSGFTYSFTESNYDAYVSGNRMALVFREPKGYSLFIIENE